MAGVSTDITIVFYTSNRAPTRFALRVLYQLHEAAEGIPIISVSQKPIEFGKNICVGGIGVSHLNIYRQALTGAKAAETKYIALCEDDVLYIADHFKYRPTKGKFAYNFNVWNVFTWGKPVFHRKDGGRRNMYSLICERELFVEAMEERFEKWPDDSKIDLSLWAEPSKYEKYLGVTVREYEKFYSNPPIVAFSHETALSFKNLGMRKKQGQVQALEVPHWGSAVDVTRLYG